MVTAARAGASVTAKNRMKISSARAAAPTGDLRDAMIAMA